jgi:phospholipase/carboxylesterase
VQLAGLTTHIVGSEDARTTVVMLHGFGAPGDDLVPLADELDAPVRWVFPEALLELGGMYGGARAHASQDQALGAAPRAWWLLDLEKLERELAAGKPRDRRAEIPEGLAAARDHVSRLIDQLEARGAERIVLGGFSQGAMLALDVALHRERPPAALLLLSGTLLAETEWQPRMAKLAGVPVVQSHGRADPLLPFSIAETLRDQLRAAGADVEWHAFVGGHEIPRAALAAVQALLVRISAK